MRRFGRRMRAMARRHMALTIGLAIATVVIAGGLSLAALSGAFNAPAPARAAGTYTFSADWTLLDLERHIDAGEVATISLVSGTSGAAVGSAGTTPNASTDVLAARTTSGQWVRVTLAVSPGDALVALRSLGFGRLIATDSVAQLPPTNGLAGSNSQSSDPFSGILQLAMLLVVLVVAVVLFRRNGMGSSKASGNYEVILPADLHGLDGDTGSVARPVRFADVAGCDEAKLELTEVVEFLKFPDRFRALGASIPRGLLLYGPPGTGKTMLARATATEAGVAFVSMSGSGFVEMYVGVGAKRVRNLFEVGRKFGKAIIFVDEIDALAKTRGGNNSNDEREQALNQLLAEMDGFSSSDSIVVIAATNRMDTLDHAVLRPGRFTRKVNVPLPDIDGRRAILGIHAVGKPLDEAVDMEALARRTAGMSGAQLADLLNESAIYAARRTHEKITPVDVHDGWLKSILGTSRKRSMDERERSIIAAHEAGHAVCGRLFGDRRRVEEISLFAHGDALGVTVSSSEDDYLPSESDLRATLIALMGGRAAESILFEDVTGGAANDLEKASDIATRMVTQWGMGHDPESAALGASGRGTLSFRVVGEESSVSAGLRAAVDRTINAILDQAYTQARETLLAEMKRLTRVAAYLYEHERIDGAQFEALFDGSLVPSADVETQWRSAKSKPRSWDEIEDLVARAVATAETSTVARAAAPRSNRQKRGRANGQSRWSAVRVLLVNWWQRGSKGVDRPAD
ncbi:MAG TPA: AAA family ATPase [Candidatus Limnocylindrales bacterium]